MLDLVHATGYIKQVPEVSGACRPLVLLTATLAGEPFEVYAKLTDGNRITISSLVNEAIASILARDLELLTPEPFLVQLSSKFIESVHEEEIVQRLKLACPIAFGTRSLPSGSSLVPSNIPLDASNKLAAAEILAFDALIDNPDRGGQPPAKNNCLIYNDHFYIIDHEKAFQSATGFIIGAKEPWMTGGLEHLRAPNSHLFINQLRQLRKKIDFTSFGKRWQNLSDARLDEYIKAFPNEWSAGLPNAQKIIKKLVNLRDNIEGCLTELKRVME